MKRSVCLLLCAVTVFLCTACGAGANGGKKERYQTSFLDLFDTASTIIAYDTSQADFDAHYQQFHDRLETYYQLYDIYTPYEGMTNLYTLNREAKNGPVKVDEKILDLLEYGKEAYTLTEGKTNICLGAVLSLWHDCREAAEHDPAQAALPDKAALQAAAEHTDINDLVLDRENSTVYFADEQLQLDVGAVAKGYAVQQVTAWAAEHLWSSAAISIGGNVTTIGYKGDDGETLWNIGVDNSDRTAEEYLVNVAITDLSVVTSGDYQRYYTVDGKNYCHIIDPDTLYPAEYVSQVTVICADSGLGDVLSTMLFNMPIDEGMAFVEGMDNVEAVWVDTSYTSYYSTGFSQYCKT